MTDTPDPRLQTRWVLVNVPELWYWCQPERPNDRRHKSCEGWTAIVKEGTFEGKLASIAYYCTCSCHIADRRSLGISEVVPRINCYE